MTSRRRASQAVIDAALDDERPTAHGARPPPRGRPPLFFSTAAGTELPFHSLHPPIVHLPPRPGSGHVREAAQPRITPGGSGVKDPPQPTVEVVTAPVHFLEGKAADVFPWTGNSPEDVLSEALVKSGISNKPQIMNETNTARPSLWSNLKNKSGVNTLSTLFGAVLEKRQQNGRIQIPNNFKPPPRLTLRDSNRESWLHDLANPNVSLRRLSRTIPHGLTGKLLLDQCLNKNIPLPRALWLAKCVGINELRSHKRKGQAGTATWGRGWTSAVEQFLDSIISTIGHGDWKPRITYALQLATYLYKEHLLEDDHFLDWIINGLDACPSERLFIWLLIVSVSQYWTDITSCRRRGKRLAESLLNYLSKLHQLEDPLAFSAALQYLENTLLRLLATQPACLLLPASWAKYGGLLQNVAAKRNHPQITHAVNRLDARNIRLQSSKNPLSSSHTPTARIFGKLDSVDYMIAVRIDDLAYDCMEIMLDPTQLISVVLQWASSGYRDGSYRTYLATRLLRRWNHLGADTYEGVLSYLRGMTWAESGEPRILFRVVAELVRSKHFSAGRYLQWLIATGSLGRNLDLALPCAWPVRLITEIPLSGLSDQVRNLRSTLLRGTAYSADLEERALRETKRNIAAAIPGLFGLGLTASQLGDVKLAHLGATVQLELGIWLRQQVAQYVGFNEHVPTKDPSIEETAAVSLITSQDFHIVRSYLEQFDDLAILADVVGIATSSLDPSVLACAADTLNYHVKAFRAIGAFDPLFGRIAMRYAVIRTIRFPERELLLSVQNVARTVRPDVQLLQLLSYDLSRLDQKSSMAACSPASDNMGEVSQYIGNRHDDEIERILSSGTSMDQLMMARVLRKMISNLELHVTKGHLQSDSYPAWFWRLRSFDEPAFDIVLRDWLASCLVGHESDGLRIAVPLLVASGCMALSNLLDSLRVRLDEYRQIDSTSAFPAVISGLRVLILPNDLARLCPPQDAYRYRLEQYKLCRGTDASIVHCIKRVAETAPTTLSPIVHQELSSLLCSEPVIAIVRRHITFDPNLLSELKMEQAHSRSSGTYLNGIIHNLLDPTGRFRLGEKSPEEQIFHIFKVASELSLPICQSAIQHIFSSDIAHDRDSVDALSAALLDAVKAAVEEDQSAGLSLLASLDTGLTDKIRRHAEREILNTSFFLANAPAMKLNNRDSVSAAFLQKYLAVIDLTSSKSMEVDDQVMMLVALVERFKGMAQAFTSCGAVDIGDAQADALSVVDLYMWLSALLRLTATHCETIFLTATHAQQAAMIGALNALVILPFLELYPSITEHIFDVAVVLSDHLSDDVRNHFSRLESMRSTNDTRCQFVLGVAAPIGGWLVLTKPVNLPLNTHVVSQPSTPLASPYHSPQLASAGPSTPQQRYFNQQLQQRQQLQQAQQAQQMRSYPQYPQQSMPQNRGLPAQLQRTPSGQPPQSSLQQMQHMQQVQALAQQRATQPSPVHSQRPTPAVSQSSAAGGPVGGNASLNKSHTGPAKNNNQQREIRHFPFVQPRWEVLAESSGNPNLNETAISLSLFGARKV